MQKTGIISGARIPASYSGARGKFGAWKPQFQGRSVRPYRHQQLRGYRPRLRWNSDVVFDLKEDMQLSVEESRLPASDDTSTEVWENQSYYGFFWQSPPFFDRAPWSDSQGRSVSLCQPPTEDEPGEWDLEINAATDDDGWQYATSFSHIGYARAGGRSCQRLRDLVRRRKWTRMKKGVGLGCLGLPDESGDPVYGLPRSTSLLQSPASIWKANKRRKQVEKERRGAASRAFWSMVMSSLRRRSLLALWPDVFALPTLQKAHQEIMAELQAAQLANALFLPFLSQSNAQGDSKIGADAAENKQLLEDLVYAVIHSRAAYGYAMLAGHMSSIYNYAMLQTVHRLDFSPAGGASKEANDDSVLKLTGLDSESLLLSEWNNSIAKPCFYVAVDRERQRIVLCIRGSLEMGDMLSNLSADPMEEPLLGLSGRVHRGMMQAALYVHNQTGPTLAEAGLRFPGWPLFITGHSLGGGVGTIVAALLNNGVKPDGLGDVTCVAIGPAAVFSFDVAERVTPFVTSLVLGSDVVPRLSYASVEDVFLALAKASHMVNAVENWRRIVGDAMGGIKVDLAGKLQHPSLVKAADGVKRATDEVKKVGLSLLTQLSEGESGWAARTVENALSQEVEMIDLAERSLQKPTSNTLEIANDSQTVGTPGPCQVPSDISSDSAERAINRLAQMRNNVGDASRASDSSSPNVSDSSDKKIGWPKVIPSWVFQGREAPSTPVGLHPTSPFSQSGMDGKAIDATRSNCTEEGAQQVGLSPVMVATSLDDLSDKVGEPDRTSMELADCQAGDAKVGCRDQGVGSSIGNGTSEEPPAVVAAKLEGVPPELAVADPGRCSSTEDGGMSEERKAIAEALGAPDRQGGVEHPEPLFVAGRVLWLLPERQRDAADTLPDEQEMISMSAAAPGEPLPAFAAVTGIPNSIADSEIYSESTIQSSPKCETTVGELAVHTNDSGCPAMTLLDVPRSCFSQILLVPDMLGDHLPDAYVKALQPVVPSHLEEYLTRVEPPGGYT
eukprot:jgi/Botrbrau1/2177/Bobra.101_2s0015.1